MFVVAALALPGCGESVPHGRGVKETVREFLRAAAAGDGSTACALLSDSGRAAMAAYPARPTAARASRTACARTVEALDRLPAAQKWAAMARGEITVDGGGGLDAQGITVSYREDPVTWVQATGSVRPPFLAVNSQILDPPFPVRGP